MGKSRKCIINHVKHVSSESPFIVYICGLHLTVFNSILPTRISDAQECESVDLCTLDSDTGAGYGTSSAWAQLIKFYTREKLITCADSQEIFHLGDVSHSSPVVNEKISGLLACCSDQTSMQVDGLQTRSRTGLLSYVQRSFEGLVNYGFAI
ncbi:hypothetical protein E3Q19_02320 [Wallemia mellicola]|nr:hypothetical protein E3Q19_02320 [Wallemia mellicola]